MTRGVEVKMLLKADGGQVDIWGQSRKRSVLLVPYDAAASVTGYSEAGLRGSYMEQTGAEM